MRGAAPVVGGDGEALAGELAAGGDVVEQAGDGQPTVAARLDIAGDERAGAGAAPLAISGRGRLRRRV